MGQGIFGCRDGQNFDPYPDWFCWKLPRFNGSMSRCEAIMGSRVANGLRKLSDFVAWPLLDAGHKPGVQMVFPAVFPFRFFWLDQLGGYFQSAVLFPVNSTPGGSLSFGAPDRGLEDGTQGGFCIRFWAQRGSNRYDTFDHLQWIKVTKGSVSYLSSPCFSTIIGGIGGASPWKT